MHDNTPANEEQEREHQQVLAAANRRIAGLVEVLERHDSGVYDVDLVRTRVETLVDHLLGPPDKPSVGRLAFERSYAEAVERNVARLVEQLLVAEAVAADEATTKAKAPAPEPPGRGLVLPPEGLYVPRSGG